MGVFFSCFMLILGKVCPAGLGKRLVRALQGLEFEEEKNKGWGVGYLCSKSTTRESTKKNILLILIIKIFDCILYVSSSSSLISITAAYIHMFNVYSKIMILIGSKSKRGGGWMCHFFKPKVKHVGTHFIGII